jgi:hypothetical protein
VNRVELGTTWLLDGAQVKVSRVVDDVRWYHLQLGDQVLIGRVVVLELSLLPIQLIELVRLDLVDLQVTWSVI